MSFTTEEILRKTFYNKDSKIWHGESAERRYGPADSIGSSVLKVMLENPDHIAQICYQSGKEFTNREILKRSIQVAQHLEKLQFKQGDIIGLCAANSDYVAPVFFGAMLSGLCINSLDPSFDKDGVKHIYSATRPRIMFCDGGNYHRVREAFEECGLSSSKIFTVSNHIDGVSSILEFFEGTVQTEDFRVPTLEKGADQPAVIVCTSGTTGFPKGVYMSHAALLNCTELPNVSVRLLCFSSLYWLSGLVALVHGTRDGITRVISENPFCADEFFDIVKRYKVNYCFGPPSQMALSLTSARLSESDLSSIELYGLGGSAVPYSLVEKFKRFAPNAKFYVGYGTSELCGSITMGVCEPSNSLGKLHVNAEVKIIDDEGIHLGPNETGEICMRSIYPWAGYFNNPDATKAAYDEDGWIHSGDTGYFNDDGQLFLVDRKSDIRKYNNFHFSPTDIEKVINELPPVADVCVVGIPDNTHGFLPAAAVVRRSGSSIEESQIYQHVADRMQHFEHLRGGIYFLDSLPQTASGKTVRRKVTGICQVLRIESKLAD